MPVITIIGDPTLNTSVREVSAPLVEIKQFWNGAWTLAPFLQFMGATANSGREGPGTCNLVHHYGPKVKEAYQADFASRAPLDLRNYWVRITMIAANGVPSIVWIGRITGETREIYSEATQPAGKQLLTALEPLHLLERTYISRSVWLQDGMAEVDALSVGFIPPMNARDDWGFLVGNRSSATVDGVYVYGGSNLWTREDYANYVLNFADEIGDGSGPGWVMGGVVAVLREVSDIVPIGDVVSVADVLRKLIDARIGLDFKIVPTDFSGTEGGFEVFVYALNATAASFGGQTMPQNPRTLNIRAIDARDFENLTIVRDAAQRYGRIRVMGKRIVCAMTLRGPLAEGGDETTPNLVPLWSAGRETEYKAGTGTASDEAELHDKARGADKFVSVYQDFGAPANWDHNGGDAAPLVNTATGELIERITSAPGGIFAQGQMRKTLSFLPFQEDSGSFMAPQLWVYDEENARYITADQAGLAITGPKGQWGVRLGAFPNHKVALNHFDPSVYPTVTDPIYDYDKMVVTIAIETDQRLELVYETGEIAGSVWKPSDGELVIQDDMAELWYAAKNTIIEVDQDGKLVPLPGDSLTILRNDAVRLYRWMAGAIGRYVNARGRADLTMRGWNPYTHAVGVILAVVDEAGDSHQIQAPITSVEYGVSPDGSGTQTIIRAGFAR